MQAPLMNVQRSEKEREMAPILPSIDAAKAQARALRHELSNNGTDISHAQSLELVAKAYGYRDWNTFYAKAGNRPQLPFAMKQIVEGQYLGQKFMGEIIGLKELSDGRYEIELELDAPVDVVSFESFSNFRSRLRKIVDHTGRSFDKTSDGRPHLLLEL